MSRAALGIRSSWVGFVAAATTAMASTIAPVAYAQVAHHVPNDGCSAVEVAVVGGTTQANIHDDPHDVYSFGKGTNFAVNMTRRFHNVTAWQLPYYSSAGITASNNDAEQKEFPPYAVSKNRGVDALDAHLSDQAVKCPDTQFVIAGFSQGADIAGDMAERISRGKTNPALTPERVLGVYLLADPGRSDLPMNPTQRQTTTGKSGPLTDNGAVLIETNLGLPGAGSVGIAGPRAEGAFNNLPGKVRSICSSGDPACAVHPKGLLASVGKWANDQNDFEYVPVESVRTMMLNGSFFISLAPHMNKIRGDLYASDPVALKQHFDDASMHPRLTQPERNTLHLVGAEIAGLMGHLKQGRDQVAVGSSDTGLSSGGPRDRLIALEKIVQQQTGLVELQLAVGLMIVHLSYTGDSREVSTVGAQRADDWIDSDMTQLISGYLNTPSVRAPYVTLGERHTFIQKMGWPIWWIVSSIWGQRNHAARGVWEFFGL
ncbi:cutinase family protein [Corynebacterium diphtheriae]|nr:cutinase family protein [Corynebacterium diphtheriae]CAB0560480.1 cutinase family protein [Corynebacterium diphtheriae]